METKVTDEKSALEFASKVKKFVDDNKEDPANIFLKEINEFDLEQEMISSGIDNHIVGGR